VRLVTWNVNSLKARLDRVEAWLAAAQPDVVCLQETKMADDAFPALAFQALGYDSAHHGQGRWNGVAILSRLGLDEVVSGFDDGDEPDPDARLLWATCGGVRVASAYVPNGRALDDPHYDYKLAWLERLRRKIATERTADDAPEVVVAGDFNVAPEDRDVWDPARFAGATHVSEPERAALAGIADLGLVDVFRQHHDDDGVYSWWDYRGGALHKGHGLRIDLVLATTKLAETCSAVRIDRDERKPTGNPAGGTPSDHAPVVAEFDLAVGEG